MTGFNKGGDDEAQITTKIWSLFFVLDSLQPITAAVAAGCTAIIKYSPTLVHFILSSNDSITCAST
jgi:hypothetical protein